MITRGACGCGKVSCSSYSEANRLRVRTNLRNKEPRETGSVYWCPEGHAYHWTRMTRSDYDRAVARSCLDGYPPLGTTSGDNPGDVGGRGNSRRETGDNSGAATATRDRPGLEILLVCASRRAERVSRK